MKLKSVIGSCLLISTVAMAGCGADTEKNTDASSIWETVESAEKDTATIETDNEIVADTSGNPANSDSASVNTSTDAEITGAAAYEHDFTEEIKADVDAAVKASSSLQEEFESIQAVTDKYEKIFFEPQTQFEMNQASGWYYQIWDAELNNLWGRFSDLADEDTKARVLADQRNWNDMKEEVVVEELGPREEGGSIYPLLRFSLLEEMTKTRSYILANEIAKITGESFTMPEKSKTYGTFVDNQGTGSVYSILITREGWEEGTTEAIISIYREGEVTGSFVDNGDGTLSFTSEDGSIKGVITINGWDGATFRVTECTGESCIFSTTETYEFPFVF